MGFISITSGLKCMRRRRFYQKEGITCAFVFIFVLFSYKMFSCVTEESNPTDFVLIRKQIESSLAESVIENKGTGCTIPHVDPFSEEVSKLLPDLPKVTCEGLDWVDCYMSECYVSNKIKETMYDINCTYRDILYITDMEYEIGPAQLVNDGEIFKLRRSDHVKVSCTGKRIDDSSDSDTTWEGHKTGFRPIEKKLPPEDAFDVLILAFDSTSHNSFKRHMPKVYQFLTTDLQATVLNSYNVVGDGTLAALFPLLTGKMQWELPDARTITNNTIPNKFFIFDALDSAGYRTAYFEDTPETGTFQYRHNGFERQPADHYLRHLLLECPKIEKWFKNNEDTRGRCIGAIPEYVLFLNLTEQFFKLSGSHFCFTFIAQLTHDEFNLKTAENDTLKFLRNFRDNGKLENTMLIVMGDHGIRYSVVHMTLGIRKTQEFRSTYQGKLEERLPFMSIVLPERLKRERPNAALNLKGNADVLTTVFDVYETLVDLLNLKGRSIDYKVQGTDLPRGMSLLKPIPSSRSCGEAGVETHWCACMKWINVSRYDRLYELAAQALADRINDLTATIRSQCIKREIISIEWVLKQSVNEKVLRFDGNIDADALFGSFSMKPQGPNVENYQVKIVMSPGTAVFEGSLKYYRISDSFFTTERDISRITSYREEVKCVEATHIHLQKYCFCKRNIF